MLSGGEVCKTHPVMSRIPSSEIAQWLDLTRSLGRDRVGLQHSAVSYRKCVVVMVAISKVTIAKITNRHVVAAHPVNPPIWRRSRRIEVVQSLLQKPATSVISASRCMSW